MSCCRGVGRSAGEDETAVGAVVDAVMGGVDARMAGVVTIVGEIASVGAVRVDATGGGDVDDGVLATGGGVTTVGAGEGVASVTVGARQRTTPG
jgi:hypothetical protein